MYPHLCTNPKVQAPTTQQNDLNIIDDIEYDSVFDIQMKDEIFLNINDTIKLASPLVNRPLVDRTSKLAAIKIYDEKQKAIDEIVEEQITLLEKAKENDEELHKVSEEFNDIYSKKQWQNLDEQLLYKMMQLESTAEDIVSQLIPHLFYVLLVIVIIIFLMCVFRNKKIYVCVRNWKNTKVGKRRPN